MNKVLARSLRPRSFSRLWGQDNIIRAIRQQMRKRPPQCFMFSGESGSGKTTIARILSMAVNCPHNKGDKFGEYCKKCALIESEIKISIERLDAAKYGKVEDVSNFLKMADYFPYSPAIKRVFILDEAQGLSKQAQDMLLIPTEDPPEHMVWIICTTDPYAIKKTLRRRFTIYPLNPLKHKVVEEFIKWAAEKAEIKRPLDDFIEYVHAQIITSPSIILSMLEHFGSGMDPDKAASASPLAVDTMRIIKGMLSGEWNHIRPELDRATGDDVRLIRAAILGYLRNQLLNRTPTMPIKLVVQAIEKIANVPYSLDESSQMSLLSARIYNLTKIFEKG